MPHAPAKRLTSLGPRSEDRRIGHTLDVVSPDAMEFVAEFCPRSPNASLGAEGCATISPEDARFVAIAENSFRADATMRFGLVFSTTSDFLAAVPGEADKFTADFFLA